MDLKRNVQEKPPFCKGIGRTKFPAIYTASAIPLDGSSSLQFCPSRRQVQLGKNKQEKDNYLPSFSEPWRIYASLFILMNIKTSEYFFLYVREVQHANLCGQGWHDKE